MKSVICAVTLLCILVGGTVFIGNYANERLEHLGTNVESSFEEGGDEGYEAQLRSIKAEYESIRLFLTLFVREEETRELEKQICDLESAIESKDTNQIKTEKNRLVLHIAQLKRLSVFSPEAIF